MFAQYAEDVIEQGERPRGDGCVLNDGADLQRIAQQQVGRHAECIGNADERLEAAALLPALDVPDVGVETSIFSASASWVSLSIFRCWRIRRPRAT